MELQSIEGLDLPIDSWPQFYLLSGGGETSSNQLRVASGQQVESPGIFAFLERDYTYKSLATQITHIARLVPIPLGIEPAKHSVVPSARNRASNLPVSSPLIARLMSLWGERSFALVMEWLAVKIKIHLCPSWTALPLFKFAMKFVGY